MTRSERLPPERLRQLDVADVYKGEALAGTLRRQGGDVVFEYDQRYLAGRGRPVGVNLPPERAPYIATGGAVPPFFANLLPEGARLFSLTRVVKTSVDDMFSLLLAVGGDCVGDVRVLPAGSDPSPPEPVVRVSDWAAWDFTELFELSISPTPGRFDPFALPGVQEKVSAATIAFPVASPAGSHILKLNPVAYPRLIENEKFMLDLAAACGLRVATADLVHDRNGLSGLLVERFDRVAEQAGLRRLAQEDSCQLLDRYPAEKYRVRMLDVARAVGAQVAAPAVALRDLIRLAAFSFVIGNEDLHAKNISIGETPDGLVMLTPAYDLVTTLPYPVQHQMALEMEGRQNKLKREHFVAFGARIGVAERAVNRALDHICDEVPRRVDRLGEIGFDEPTTAWLAEQISQRRDALGAGR